MIGQKRTRCPLASTAKYAHHMPATITSPHAASTTIALQRVVNDVVTNNTDPQRGTNGAAWVYPAYRMAGERNEDSTTGTDYMSTSAECKPSGEIDISAGSGTIYNGPAVVQWVQVSTTPGTAASSIDDNATAKIPLPVSFPVGVYSVSGAVFCTSLKYTRGASATGKINVCYRPLDSGQVTWACP